MGETHEKTKESSEYLKFLTQQAVALQRTMNEIYKNGSHASIMPLKVASSQLLPASDSCRPVSSDANWLFFNFFFIPLVAVYCSKHGQRPGTAQHYQRHHLYPTQVTDKTVLGVVHNELSRP